MSKRTKFLLGIGVIATLVVGWQVAAFAGAVGTAQGFQDDDGNLIDDGAGIDWNSFDPISWVQSATPATPTRQADKTDLGFTFKASRTGRPRRPTPGSPVVPSRTTTVRR